MQPVSLREVSVQIHLDERNLQYVGYLHVSCALTFSIVRIATVIRLDVCGWAGVARVTIETEIYVQFPNSVLDIHWIFGSAFHNYWMDWIG